MPHEYEVRNEESVLSENMETVAAPLSGGGGTAKPEDAHGAIDIKAVTHEFPGNVLAVSDANLRVRGGEFVSIVGPSGCGKTTLLNLLAGLIDVQTGSISLAGSPPKAGRHDVAYMLARDCLFPWRTALSNATLGGEFRGVPKKERVQRARDMLRKVGLSGFENNYPKALSHGMRQRVALARTFSLSSSILLMDEPFGALDAQTKLQLEDVLLDLWTEERRTVVFITHDLNEAVTLSDRVIVMSARPGRIIKDIPIPLERPRSARALQKDPLYHEIYAEVWTWLEQGLNGGDDG
ncbi:MAG: ABC transporter ATP-binding protein [Ectothiorhodospiraceae bacterium]|nr:ABC transporter ATP-binding protein [Ectothiorhodospiraceae bacterium]